MVLMRNFKFMLFFIVLNNFSATQQQCRDFKNNNAFPRKQIYLLQSDLSYHREINERFIMDNGYQNIMKIMDTNCELEVKDMIEYSKYFPYLINLWVPNFFQNNYNEVKESLVYVEDIDYFPMTYVNRCISVKEPKDGLHRCEPSFYPEIKYTKLCTTQLETENEGILEKVSEFKRYYVPFPSIPVDQPVVIVCGKTIDRYSKTIRHHIYYYFVSCEDFRLNWVNNHTLAILAPTSFNVPRPIDNPVLFYEDAYITKETKDWFKNAVAGFNWQSLKYGFLYFIKKMGWMRVAIISDSTEFSQEFEQDLTTLLSENGITYMAETCVSPNCTEVIDKIVKNGAKIIIANLDIKNMKEPASYANSKNLVRDKGVIWITRNLKVFEAREAVKWLNSEIFNIYFERDYSLSDVDRVLNITRSLANCDAEYCSYSKSKAAALLKASPKTSKIEIDNVKNNSHPNYCNIGSITVVNDTLTKKSLKYPHHIEDSYKYCMVRSNRFEDPCNDIELMLLMVVITVFVLTVLGVVLFFEAPEFGRSYRRMRFSLP